MCNPKKVFLLVTMLIIGMTCITGCKKKNETEGEHNPLEFTVVEEADIPKDFLKIINEKKEKVFRISYTDNESIYIARGYGAKESGGYSISVSELYSTDDKVYLKTELIGPSEKEPVIRSVTHPYIVVKIEFIDKEIVIE